MHKVPVNKPYYEIVHEVLAANIANGRLQRGLRLSTSAVADRLGVSRPPVKRALELLASDGLILRGDGQGYLVGAQPDAPIVRVNLHQLDLELPERLAGHPFQPTWERIFEAVESDILSCIPFGTYKISETVLGTHFGVSRTVVRDVLSRLHVRGIIAKDRSSHWIAGPLGARKLDEAHEIRRLLEPSALCVALPRLDHKELGEMRERVSSSLACRTGVSQETIDMVEIDLHETCISVAPNRRLVETVRHTQLAIVINRLFSTYIGSHNDANMLMEHRLVLDHMILGDCAGASAALLYHLDADHRRARARLKVLSVFSEPDVVAYLTRIH